MTKKFICIATALLGLFGCEKSELKTGAPGAVRVAVNVVTDMTARSAATAEENAVVSFDIYLFDVRSGLLEQYQQGIGASSPQQAAAGENRVGEVTLLLPDGQPKNLLAIGNATQSTVGIPAIEIGVTTYAAMLEATARLAEGASPASPFVMSGYLNNLTSADAAATVSLCRSVAKLAVVNRDTSGDLVISSLQLKQGAARSLLFKTENGDAGPHYADYPVMAVDLASGAETACYLLPQTVANNRAYLAVGGTFKGVAFTQQIAVKPVNDKGEEVDIEPNCRYAVTLTAESGAVKTSVSVHGPGTWVDKGEIAGVITGSETVTFNGLQWMVRNVGAASADLEKAWAQACGSFYQWGRNTAFTPGEYATVSGPLSAEEVAANAGGAFITKMSGDWLSPSDDALWDGPSKQPCPEGYRLPSAAEFFGIIPSTGVLFNMYNGPKIVWDEPLVTGKATAQYFGDNSSKLLYGIKRQGTDDAYYLKWEYLKTTAGNAFVKISRWAADAAATFESKDLAAVRDEFSTLGAAEETLVFAAAGYLTGSNGSYGDNKGGYYWTSSPNGTGAWRAEFTDGKVVMTTPYNSRVSGHSLRCVKI